MTILFLHSLLYLSQALLIYAGTHRLTYPKTKSLPKISILVALRNEDVTLETCVNSLLRLDYPRNKIEIILINDRSTDGSAAMIEHFKEISRMVKTVHIRYCIKGLSGKANAIAQGIEHSTGELILVTDGDCCVPRGWAKAHVSYYQPQVGIVSGFTLLDKKFDSTPLFGKIQSLDWVYLLSVGAGSIGMGVPLSVLGNNFSFRRCAYDQVGGYRNMGFTIIEDFALMKTVHKKTSWKVLYPIDKEMVVYSYPMPTFKKFYEQRKRWSAGGKEVGLYGKLLMTISYVNHILLPLSFLLLNNPVFSLAALVCVLLSDFFLLSHTTGRVGRKDVLRYFPLWEIFYFFYTTLFALVLLFPTKVNWKGMTYSWKFNWKLKKVVDKQ
ncbi:MAG: glycosyltransferase [bacterium]